MLVGCWCCQDGYDIVGAERGIARCPHDPNHNSTAVYFGEFYFNDCIGIKLLELSMTTNFS